MQGSYFASLLLCNLNFFPKTFCLPWPSCVTRFNQNPIVVVVIVAMACAIESNEKIPISIFFSPCRSRPPHTLYAYLFWPCLCLDVAAHVATAICVCVCVCNTTMVYYLSICRSGQHMQWYNGVRFVIYNLLNKFLKPRIVISYKMHCIANGTHLPVFVEQAKVRERTRSQPSKRTSANPFH